MKILDRGTLVRLNDSSVRAGRKQNLAAEIMPSDPAGKYVVNFHFDHKWEQLHDVRMSLVLKPGSFTAWLDVSPDEYESIPDEEMSELDWEAAVCVGTPRWTA